MSVASLNFLLFVLVTVIVFYICPVKYRWIVLLISSVAFYVIAGSVNFLPYIILTSFAVWIFARGIGKQNAALAAELEAEGLSKEEKKALKAKYKARSRTLLILALVVGIGVLCVTKFSHYVIDYMLTVPAYADGAASAAMWILVPLGISYYTFSTVGYILDVYWKRCEHEENFFRFFLYAIYFPHIVQGPISRYRLLGQELKKELRFDYGRAAAGVQLMIWGFFKKLVIADRLHIFVSNVYDGGMHPGSIFLVTCFFDAMMIYTDFSGYMDIVRGVSQIFGVELEPNFNHPFFSKSVPEFWRRWHMSLGGWFKDYVYYPLTVSKWMKAVNKKTGKKPFGRFLTVAIPVLITWFLTGLWHGTGLPYICWGIYYGVLITLSVGFARQYEAMNRALHINTEAFSFRLFRMIRIFFVFMGGRLLTSPGSLENTGLVLRTIFTDFQGWLLFDGSLVNYGLEAYDLGLLFVCFFIVWAVSMMQERFGVRERLAGQNLVFRWVIMYAAIFAVIIFGEYGIGYDPAAFIYMQY
ncbi:MAG: MBOAT family protein [Clostridia bacterium]|nr:MBOAT family protein [Clostridia bacterium]